jgi:hypothetical protein
MKTAYEIGLFNWNSGIYVCLFETIISISFIVYYKKHKFRKSLLGFCIVFMLFSIFGLINGLKSHYTQYYELKSYTYKIIEGEISNYKRDAKGTQYFSVNGQDFKMLSNGYIEQPSHSDDFAKNLSDNKYLVKIYYSGKYILKVEYQE